jgi:hypothetical protein
MPEDENRERPVADEVWTIENLTALSEEEIRIVVRQLAEITARVLLKEE